MSEANKLYEQLEQRIAKLRQHFLKDRAEVENPTDLPLLDEDLDLHAYSLMAHASFEFYFEKMAEFILSASIAQWETARRTSLVLLCLLVHYRQDHQNREISRLVQDYLRGQIQVAQKEHKNKIKSNNGISSKDINRLFGPLGIDGYVNHMSLGSLDTFSTTRGAIAHTHGTVSFGIQEVKTWVDDALEIARLLRDEVNEILSI